MKHFFRIAVVLLLAGVCFGQMSSRKKLFGKLQSTIDIQPPSLLGIRFRWISTNLPTPVTKWTDVVSGYSLTNSANYPTAVGTGVVFTGSSSQYLLGTNGTITSDMTWAYAAKFSQTNGWQPIVCWNANEVLGVRNGIWCIMNATWGEGVVPNALQTYIQCYAAPGAMAASSVFTNGVLGTSGSGIDGTTVFNAMGKVGANYLSGTVYELIVWTNSVTFGTNDVAQIHRYFTNKYGGL